MSIYLLDSLLVLLSQYKVSNYLGFEVSNNAFFNSMSFNKYYFDTILANKFRGHLYISSEVICIYI